MIQIVRYQGQQVPDQVLSLIGEQVESKSLENIKHIIDKISINHAIDLCVLWLDDEAIAFSYGNMSVGLESGGSYFWLNEFYVKKNYRHKGYGRMLFMSLKEMLKENGIHYLALVTGKMNKDAQSFFNHVGLTQRDYLWYDVTIK